VEALIALGHPPADVWGYTLLQAKTFLFIAGKRRQAEQASLLALHATAARGDPKEIRRILKDAEK
jgi:hypothetical protein